MLEKNEGGDASGESILSGFGSSCGSSTDETSDQEEFIAELTRQMAENMLQDDDEKKLTNFHLPPTNKPKPSQFHPIHVVQNNKQGKKYRQQNQQHRYGNGSSRTGFLTSPLQNGSGMKVVFLGEIGSKNGSSGGTGVFIPHATNNLPDHQPRKKPGRCPTVLMPERVLQTLKQHFERTANQAHPNGVFHTNHNRKLQPQEASNKRVANNDVNNQLELQLPQEWTY
ncbi:hypothetical protein POM88_050455 [Heracleum sosnowskyi]|uniref:Uncharacterized protein n=1 Tax=Heracleum sosnowskyi TaxID=360622 RepID=A0AAD8M2E1_9APIA|nr:hypothetical protein POM88_050455 [Heracleum sosnowskyi]